MTEDSSVRCAQLFGINDRSNGVLLSGRQPAYLIVVQPERSRATRICFPTHAFEYACRPERGELSDPFPAVYEPFAGIRGPTKVLPALAPDDQVAFLSLFVIHAMPVVEYDDLLTLVRPGLSKRDCDPDVLGVRVPCI